MSTENQNSDDISESKQTGSVSSPVASETAASRFRNRLAEQQGNRDDYEPEEELWSGGFSPKAMVGTWVLTGLITIGLLIAALIVPFSPLAAVVIALVLWVIIGLLYAYKRLAFHYQLTSQRFIHQTGILTRKTDRIEVIDIDDVSYTQGPVQRLFGVGTITLTGSDRTHPTLSMFGIANVREVAGLIDDIRRKERRERSLHIEAI